MPPRYIILCCFIFSLCIISFFQFSIIYICQSLIEFKAMNVEKQRHIFVELWSDSIHIYPWVGYTLFANYYKTSRKWKFHRKNCKFVKLDENHATHYSTIVQSFVPESNIFSLRKKSFWVHHWDCSPGETRRTEFHKKTFCEMLHTTLYTLFVVRTNFVVLSSRFWSGSRIVSGPLYGEKFEFLH